MFLQGHTCVLGAEPKEHAVILYNENYLVCNAFMASAPQHPFWKTVFQELKNRRHTIDPPLSTGPRMLQAAFHAFNPNADQSMRVNIVNAKLMYPKYDPFAEIPQKCASGHHTPAQSQKNLCEELKKEGFKNEVWLESFAEHHWAHTWFGEGSHKYGSDIPVRSIVLDARNDWKVSRTRATKTKAKKKL